MGKCRYCGLNAGLLRGAHKECERRRGEASDRLEGAIRKAISDAGALGSLAGGAGRIGREAQLSADELRDLSARAWADVVDSLCADSIPTPEQERRLTDAARALGLSQQDLDRGGSYGRLVKGAVLRDIFSGTTPRRFNAVGGPPFNLQAGETLIWAFPNTQYYELRAHRTYEGSSTGWSYRVFKGVYYRTGAFKGHPVETLSTDLVDAGVFGITDQNLYFSGSTKGLRIPFKKIVTFVPYQDGLGVQRDAVSARQQTFLCHDGAFAYNLVMNLQGHR